jgi:hypothetical protein
MGWGQGGEMTQALYAHINNKRKKNKDNPCVYVKNMQSTQLRFYLKGW